MCVYKHKASLCTFLLPVFPLPPQRVPLCLSCPCVRGARCPHPPQGDHRGNTAYRPAPKAPSPKALSPPLSLTIVFLASVAYLPCPLLAPRVPPTHHLPPCPNTHSCPPHRVVHVCAPSTPKVRAMEWLGTSLPPSLASL